MSHEQQNSLLQHSSMISKQIIAYQFSPPDEGEGWDAAEAAGGEREPAAEHPQSEGGAGWQGGTAEERPPRPPVLKKTDPATVTRGGHVLTAVICGGKGVWAGCCMWISVCVCVKDREGQLRNAHLDLQSSKKQIQQQSQEVGVCW